MKMIAITALAVQLLAVCALPPLPPPGVLAPGVNPPGVQSPANLRGVSAPAPSPAAAAAAPAATPFVDERGERGHFYYADSCDDCVYKGAQCGCQAAVEYFACLTKHCHAANHSKFAAKCAAVATNCSSELDITCAGPDSQCVGKYNQLPSGGIGLSLDLDGVDDDAFCGPHGKCIGNVHMKVNVHNAPPAAAAPAAAAPAPAPGPAAAQGLFIECGLPAVSDNRSNVDNQTHWTLCRAPVVANKAACDLPMISHLEAGEGKEAYCVLTEGTVGNPPKRLTEPAWHLISNTHPTTTTTPAGLLGGMFGGMFGGLR